MKHQINKYTLLIACMAILELQSAAVSNKKPDAQDTVEQFKSFRGHIEQNITFKNLSKYTIEPLPEAEAQKICNEIRTDALKLLQPLLQSVQLPRSAEDQTLMPYQLMDFTALTKFTPQQARNVVTLPEFLRLEKISEDYAITASLPLNHAQLLKSVIADIAAQLTSFNAHDREELSKLLIAWFNFISTEIPAVVNLIKDMLTPAEQTKNPEIVINPIKNLRTKARQHQHLAAPLLAFWNIIIEGALGTNSYTLLFDQLPNSDKIKAAYAAAQKSFNFDQFQPFFETAHLIPELQKIITPGLFVWIAVGILFLPESFEKEFIEPLLQEMEESQKRRLEYQKQYELQEKEENIKIEKFLKENPGALKRDYYWNDSESPEFESNVKKIITQRNLWVAQHPGAVPEDFDVWHVEADNEHYKEMEKEFKELLTKRTAWLKEHPDKSLDYF